MVDAVLRAADAGLSVRRVSATKSKAARAGPVALRFETKRARWPVGFLSWRTNSAR